MHATTDGSPRAHETSPGAPGWAARSRRPAPRWRPAASPASSPTPRPRRRPGAPGSTSSSGRTSSRRRTSSSTSRRPSSASRPASRSRSSGSTRTTSRPASRRPSRPRRGPTSSSSRTTTRSSTRPRWPTCRDVAEEIGRRAGWLVRLRQGQHGGGRALDRRAAVHHLVGDHLPRGLVQGSTASSTRRRGTSSERRGAPESQGQAVRPGVRPQHQRPEQLVLSAGVDVGRDGGRQGRKTVVLDGKAVVEAIKFNNVLWKEVFDEGGLGWDDRNNNRAFLSQRDLADRQRAEHLRGRAAEAPDVYGAPTTATIPRARPGASTGCRRGTAA